MTVRYWVYQHTPGGPVVAATGGPHTASSSGRYASPLPAAPKPIEFGRFLLNENTGELYTRVRLAGELSIKCYSPSGGDGRRGGRTRTFSLFTAAPEGAAAANDIPGVAVSHMILDDTPLVSRTPTGALSVGGGGLAVGHPTRSAPSTSVIDFDGFAAVLSRMSGLYGVRIRGALSGVDLGEASGDGGGAGRVGPFPIHTVDTILPLGDAWHAVRPAVGTVFGGDELAASVAVVAAAVTHPAGWAVAWAGTWAAAAAAVPPGRRGGTGAASVVHTGTAASAVVRQSNRGGGGGGGRGPARAPAGGGGAPPAPGAPAPPPGGGGGGGGRPAAPPHPHPAAERRRAVPGGGGGSGGGRRAPTHGGWLARGATGGGPSGVGGGSGGGQGGDGGGGGGGSVCVLSADRCAPCRRQGAPRPAAAQPPSWSAVVAASAAAAAAAVGEVAAHGAAAVVPRRPWQALGGALPLRADKRGYPSADAHRGACGCSASRGRGGPSRRRRGAGGPASGGEGGGTSSGGSFGLGRPRGNVLPRPSPVGAQTGCDALKLKASTCEMLYVRGH